MSENEWACRRGALRMSWECRICVRSGDFVDVAGFDSDGQKRNKNRSVGISRRYVTRATHVASQSSSSSTFDCNLPKRLSAQSSSRLSLYQHTHGSDGITSSVLLLCQRQDHGCTQLQCQSGICHCHDVCYVWTTNTCSRIFGWLHDSVMGTTTSFIFRDEDAIIRC